MTDYEEWVLGRAGEDSDGDGQSDDDERAAGTDPYNIDSDGAELRGCTYTDPVSGLTVVVPSSPVTADTDGDGLDDGLECRIQTGLAGPGYRR